jgi:hypothetical protein
LDPSVQLNEIDEMGHVVLRLVVHVNVPTVISPVMLKSAVLFARKISHAGFFVYGRFPLVTAQLKNILHVKGTLSVNDIGILIHVLPALSLAMTYQI